jgi:hypothetical protein
MLPEAESGLDKKIWGLEVVESVIYCDNFSKSETFAGEPMRIA